MEILKFFESIRTPFLDRFFSLITHFGEETVFIIIGFLLLWCLNKKKGYYVLFVGIFGLLANQFLKIACRVPRPWVKDKSFTIVESARTEATGYSFPSGHTQISVGAYGSIARAFCGKVMRVICILLCILVPLSRLYLGVHTPLDVFVSVGIALVLIFVLYPLIVKFYESKTGMRVLFALLCILSLSYVFYMEFFSFPIGTDAENLLDATKNSYKILGITLGAFLGFELDRMFINYDTAAPFWGQVLKLVLGTAVVLIIKEGLKSPLYALCQGHVLADAIRYFIIVVFACCVWPLAFKFFAKNCNKKRADVKHKDISKEEIK